MSDERVVRRGYWLPGGGEQAAVREAEYVDPVDGSRLVLQLPELAPELLCGLTERLRERQREWLAEQPVGRIVDWIDAAAARWLDPTDERRRLAERWVPVITGYDAETVRLELKRFMRLFRRKELLRFLDEEFDAAGVLDGFRPRKHGGWSRAFGPELLFQVYAGNVPGLPVWSLVMGLLVKSAAIGKTSSAEPLLAVLFAESLAEVEPKLGECMAIVPWKGGDRRLERPVIEAADATIVYGSQRTVDAVRELMPSGKRLVSYGHKISFGLIGREALTPDRYVSLVQRAAEDAAVYDQQGCLSPHCLYVERGGIVTPRQFAQLLASELERYEVKRPRARLLPEEASAIRAVRDRYELEQLRGEPVALYASGEGTAWTVVYHDRPGFEPSPLNRTVHVFGCESLEQAAGCTAAYREYVQTAGVAVGPDRLEPLATVLGRSGVTRICAIGEMAHVGSGWHHDGRFNLLDLVRWVDVDRSAEIDAERYDPDVE